MFDVLRKKKKDHFTCTCNHDPNSSSSTLKQVSKKTMVTPERCGFFCPNCGEVFLFSKDSNGHFSKI